MPDIDKIINEIKELKQSYDSLDCFAADFWQLLIEFLEKHSNKLDTLNLLTIADDFFRRKNSLNKTTELIAEQLDQIWEKDHARHR